MTRTIAPEQLARLLAVPAGARPYYRALAEALRGRVHDGAIPVGVRLPAERHLAAALGVSRTTVTAAYDLLKDHGYVTARQGSGSTTALPVGGDTPWTILVPGDGMIPLHVASMPAASQVAPAVAAAAASYHRHLLGIGYDPVGLPVLREAVARRYTERGVATRPEQILITPGAQQAMHLLFALLVRPGDPVLLESPTYAHAIQSVRLHGARAVAAGELMESSLRQAKVAYVLPDFHNPTGTLMGAPHRAALVAAARRHDVTLICDETWGEVAVDDVVMPPPLARWDTDNRVITIGSASKLWWGGLRVGWLRGTAELVERLSVLRSGVDLATAVFDQLVVAELFPRVEESRAERRAWLATSRDALTAALAEHLPGWAYPRPVGGGSIWAKLDVPSAAPVVQAAATNGVRLAPGRWFGVDGACEGYLRLSYCHPPHVLADAVARIAAGRPGEAPAADTRLTMSL
ncbi:PLP-dependent aminotransferase family protein [Herbidospora cretacea]|uniref:MocR-like transcription factor YczR n=1 Tax=Herbidospora cretacea TaxID=28444 RepID=UPI00068FFDAE|nr:PLP-dependent aminotransferase family protein [Herbidospora cretacea]